MRVRRRKQTLDANPLVNDPGKTLELRPVHFLAHILPNPRFNRASWLGHEGVVITTSSSDSWIWYPINIVQGYSLNARTNPLRPFS